MYGLGRNVSTKDNRDYRLINYIHGVPSAKEKIWTFDGDALDQKETPHCGGFGMAHYGICHPMPSMYTEKQGHEFYYRCKEFDLEPGMENGTSVRSVANVGRNLGMWETYAFATTMEEINYWILNEGPIMIGTEWTMDMFVPDKDAILRPTGNIAGGHFWLADGKIDGMTRGLTSWGPDFGVNGHFWMYDADLEALFHQQGEAIAAVEVAKVDPSVQSGCRNTPLGKALARMLG
jgi:hypothetical protein